MSLSLRLVVFGFVLAVLAGTAVAWGLTLAAGADLRVSLESRGLSMARGVAVRVTAAVQQHDAAATQAVLDRLWEERDIARVQIVDERGAVRARRDFKATAGTVKVRYPILGPELDGAASPVGMVQVVLSDDSLAKRQAQYVRRAVWVTASVAALGLLLALAVGWALARPLRRLQVLSTEIAEGRYMHALDDGPVKGPREVQALGLVLRGAVYAVAERERSLRMINQQLQETEAARDAMTHMVIHDLKGPIGNVITMLGLLEAARMAAADRGLVGEVRQRCRSLLRTIEQQLDLARLSGGEMPVNRSVVEVGELLLGALDQVRALLDEAGFEVQVVLPDADVELAVDRALMERVVVNLLVNAVQHGASPIALSVVVDDGVCIEVSDAGPGVAPGKEAAVFERYHTGAMGSGLGLALVRMAVEAHGGTVTVRGARFSLRLPA